MTKENKKEVKTHLSAAQYWEWFATIQCQNVANEKFKNAELQFKLMTKDAENKALNAQMYMLTTVKNFQDKAQEAKAEYERFKKVIEEDIGQSLNGKMITETFEVVDLPQTENQPNRR